MNNNTKTKMRDLWSKGPKEAAVFLSGIYEHSPWVADSLLSTNSYRDLTTISELATAMKAIVDASTEDQKLVLLRSHPDLAQKIENLKELTAESQTEQSSAGLQCMTAKEQTGFGILNAQYKKKFDFPFILAVRNATKHTVLSALESRVHRTKEQEMATAMEQVHKIAWMRIVSKLESDISEGFLTCHVLDTANGCPAAGMRISLRRILQNSSGMEQSELISNFVTNHDGRLEGGPALQGPTFEVGTYEWTFYAGDYFASRGNSVAGTPFLDQVPLRFGIDNPDDHYHVPLLVSPWSYSTYRGS